MTTRRDERLQRVQVASPCEAAWDDMEGDARRRRCLQCDRHVYDFAQLTPREIAGLIEASRGRLCGRVTRDRQGRLVTRPTPPPAAAPAPAWRVPPLLAATVTAVLGLGATACSDAAAARPLPVSAEAGEPAAGESPRGQERSGAQGGVLGGRLTNEAGEPVPGARIAVHSQLDPQEAAAVTDADGRFSVALPAGIYWLQATVGEHDALFQSDILLAGGERRQLGLTVPAEVWERYVTGLRPAVALGGVIAMPTIPLRTLLETSSVAVLGTAGPSAVTSREEYTWEVRTDLVISAVIKGETRERVISVFHQQSPDEDPASRLRPGDRVLAFLETREAADGRGSDGYRAAEEIGGLRILDAAEAEAYRQRLDELARITRRGTARPDEVLEWMVAATEDPATRKEVVGELGGAFSTLESQAESQRTPLDRYAADLRTVIEDYLAAGGRPESHTNPVIFAAFLHEGQRERLAAALLRTPRVTRADLDLYRLVSRWDDRALPWLIDRLRKGEVDPVESRGVLQLAADGLDDPALADLLAAGELRLGGIQGRLYSTSDPAEERRLEAQLEAAEEELRREFLDALAGRVRR